MHLKLTLLCLLVYQFALAQQYDSLVIEEENIDTNNTIYKTGSVFVYDYEIIFNDETYKLKKNKGMFGGVEFELATLDTDSIIEVEKIHLIVRPVLDAERSNDNQTQISYLQDPIYASLSSTGAVENEANVWIHPIRKGFFNSLETAPFPFVKKPLAVGSEWHDQMLIGQGWGSDMWGKWDDQLLLNYHYQITALKTLETDLGKIDCYVIVSTAKSDIGTTKMTSYYSEKYGFVRLEYELLNELNVNMWLIDYKSDQEFNDVRTFFVTKAYIKQ
ncbi:MAG: hypothetical protein GYB35_04330 [Algicola sp.]|nr:hypothetical protein [Algicola sp.]